VAGGFRYRGRKLDAPERKLCAVLARKVKRNNDRIEDRLAVLDAPLPDKCGRCGTHVRNGKPSGSEQFIRTGGIELRLCAGTLNRIVNLFTLGDCTVLPDLGFCRRYRCEAVAMGRKCQGALQHTIIDLDFSVRAVITIGFCIGFERALTERTREPET